MILLPEEVIPLLKRSPYSHCCFAGHLIAWFGGVQGACSCNWGETNYHQESMPRAWYRRHLSL